MEFISSSCPPYEARFAVSICVLSDSVRNCIVTLHQLRNGMTFFLSDCPESFAGRHILYVREEGR
ncbi:Uncharacterized protein Y057_2506 [Fusarium fujikuroi]|nr:Uncharacterized protein Y057_2506 [Fusarium fujikuroi]